MSLISTCAVGIPTFLLAQENNFNRIQQGFLRYVFMNAFPAAVTITGCVFTIMLVCQNVYHSNEMLNTACVLVTGWNYMAALKTVYAPLNRYRKVIIYGMQFIFFAAAVILQKLLALGCIGVWYDYPCVYPDDIFTGIDRCDHSMDPHTLRKT